VANTFLSLKGWKVRGVTRDPSSLAAQALAENGVDIVKGDLNNKQSLFPAFEGATVIFANTDFFGHLFGASTKTLEGRTPRQYAYDREVEQGINIAEAAASPRTLMTLERFVFSSLSDARKWSQGKYTEVYHHNSKTDIIQTIRTKFPDLAARMSTVQIGHYVRNWQNGSPLAPQKQSDGSFLVKRTFSPSCEIPFVVTHKDTGAFVKALVDLPPGTDLLSVSEQMTWPKWTEAWSDTLKVKATFKQVSVDEFWAGTPEPVKDELVETFAYVDEFGYTGRDPDILTLDQVSPICSKATKFRLICGSLVSKSRLHRWKSISKMKTGRQSCSGHYWWLIDSRR
jgi:hypothetical protein